MGFSGASPLDFCDAFCEAFASDGDSQWDSDEVGILEFEAGALVAVIHQDIDSGFGKFPVDAF